MKTIVRLAICSLFLLTLGVTTLWSEGVVPPTYAEFTDDAPVISTFQVGPHFWRYYDEMYEASFEMEREHEWHGFAEGNLWIIYLYKDRSFAQLPALVLDVLEQNSEDDPIEGIQQLHLTIGGEKRLMLQLVYVEDFLSEGNSIEVVDCKAAALLFSFVYERIDQGVEERFDRCAQ